MPRSLRTEVLWGLGVGLVMGLGLYYLLELMPLLGRNIPNTNITEDYFRGVLVAILLLGVVFILPCRQGEYVPLLLMWGGRSVITLFVMLFYEYKYGLDAYNYYHNAVNPQIILDSGDRMISGTLLISQFARQIVHYVPFMASYHALKVFWSFFGFLGSYISYRAYVNYSGRDDIKLLWALGIFPSIIFWSSILGKDPITFFGVSLAFYGSLPLLKRLSLWHAFIFAAGLSIAGTIRHWMIPIFLAPFVFIHLLRIKTNWYVKGLSWAISLSALIYFSSGLLEKINVDSQSDAVDTIARVSRSWSHGGSGQQVQALSSTADIVKFMPVAMFTALFRPLPGEVKNIFGLFAGFENLFIFLSFLFAIYAGRRYLRQEIFVQYSVLTLLIWSAFYGLVSYQNLGTAVRFKLQVLPIMILLPYHVWQLRKKKSDS